MYKLMKENLHDSGAPDFVVGVFNTATEAQTALETFRGAWYFELLYIICV